MFDSKQGLIPGYTGHQRSFEEIDAPQRKEQAIKQIPGYAGYIPGVKSENLYGKTYGKTTYSSSANDFPRGIDQPADIKFSTTMKQEFIHHATKTHETVAQTVGVVRGNSVFTRPVPPAAIAAFYGSDDPQVADPFAARDAIPDAEQAEQHLDAAAAVFYGVEQNPQGLALGAPIPGYSGVNRRVEADNVFGMTYAEALRKADESQKRICNEKGDTLKATSTFKR